MKRVSALAAVAAVLPSIAAAQPAENPAPPISSLERGFRACLLQVSSNSYLTDASADDLAAAKLMGRDDPPADVKLMASRLFPRPTYLTVADGGEGTVWLVAGKDQPVCKVTFSDHNNPLQQRLDFSGLLLKAESWTYERGQSGSNGGLMREAFTLNSKESGPVVKVFVDGPQTVLNGGKGIQAIVTVAVIPRKD